MVNKQKSVFLVLKQRLTSSNNRFQDNLIKNMLVPAIKQKSRLVQQETMQH